MMTFREGSGKRKSGIPRKYPLVTRQEQAPTWLMPSTTGTNLGTKPRQAKVKRNGIKNARQTYAVMVPSDRIVGSILCPLTGSVCKLSHHTKCGETDVVGDHTRSICDTCNKLRKQYNIDGVVRKTIAPLELAERSHGQRRSTQRRPWDQDGGCSEV